MAEEDGEEMTAPRIPITPATCYVDGSPGHGFSVEWWAACDWSKAYVDPGPSPAGNAGPYLHVANRIADTVHRIYPRVRRGRVTGFVREVGEWISWVVEYPDALTSARAKPLDAPLTEEEFAALLAEPRTDLDEALRRGIAERDAMLEAAPVPRLPDVRVR